MLKRIFTLNILRKLFFAAITIKIFVSLLVSIEGAKDGPKAMFFRFYRTINNDEQLNAHVAFNYNTGSGFTDSVSTFNYGPHRLKLTAYRPTFPIVMHIIYQRIYYNFLPLKTSDINTLTSQYYNIYALIVHYFSLFLFLISIPFFRSLAFRITQKREMEYVLTIVYILHPASLYYLGLYPLYENMVMPLFVIAISKLIDLLSEKQVKGKIDYLIIPTLITLACLLRPHVLISSIFIIGYLVVFAVRSYKEKGRLTTVGVVSSLLIFFMTLSHGLIIYKNYKRIGKAVLSTEASQAFFLGHNPYTRGSWAGDSETTGSPTDLFRRKNIPDLETLSEAGLDEAHKRVAWQWIKENPAKELELVVRKAALFMLPYNYGNLHFDVILFLINVGFIGFCIMWLLNFSNKKYYSHVLVLSALVVGGAILMTEYAFFSYRYICYAQPFMLLLAGYFYMNVKLPIRILKFRNKEA